MDCNKPTTLGEPCGKCRPCIAHEVKTEVNDVVGQIESDLIELRSRDMGREANQMLNEAIFTVLKRRVK